MNSYSCCRSAFCALLAILLATPLFAAEKPPRNLAIAPGGLGDDFVAIFWDKPDPNSNPTVTGYSVMRNGSEVATTSKLHAFVSKLTPATAYTFSVRANGSSGQSADGNALTVTTRPAATVFNVLDYGAKGDGVTDDWAAIKAAIAACTPGGKVFFPGGKTYLSGTVQVLKSDIFIHFGDSAVLQANPAHTQEWTGTYFYKRNSGTNDANEFPTLFIIGHLPPRDSAGFVIESQKRVVSDVRIYGNAAIYCSSRFDPPSPESYVATSATLRARNVLWQGLTLYGGEGWLNTIDYSDNITIMDCKVGSPEPEKGFAWSGADGWNVVFSSCIYFMGCDFATHDDCLCFKTEKCRTGLLRPICPILDSTGYVHHVRITNCRFFRSVRSAAICAGSELSQGVSDIFVQDCQATGMQAGGFNIKGAPDRGGFVRNIVVRDSRLDFSGFTYYAPCNADGPYPNDIRDILFENVQSNSGMCTATNQPVRNVTFINCTGSLSMSGPTENWRFYGCSSAMRSTGATVATSVPADYGRLAITFPCNPVVGVVGVEPRPSGRPADPGVRLQSSGAGRVLVIGNGRGAEGVIISSLSGRLLARSESGSGQTGVVATPAVCGSGVVIVTKTTGLSRCAVRLVTTR